MSRILAFASTALLFVRGLASPQIYYARPTPTGNPGTLVRTGYERYLNREPGTSGDTWIQAIRNGQTREDFLASLLSSDEYLAEAGGTRPAYVRKLYRD